MSAAHEPIVVVDDAQLMERLAGGNLSVLAIFYDRLGDHVRHFVLRATGNPSVVDDITQDAFLGLASAAKRYDPDKPVRSFLIGIAAKLVLRERRRVAITTRILGELKNRLSGVDARTPEGSAEATEHLIRYDRALARLTDAKRVAVLMADFEGMCGADIAAALDIPIGTVWTRLHKARAELKRAVFEGGEGQ